MQAPRQTSKAYAHFRISGHFGTNYTLSEDSREKRRGGWSRHFGLGISRFEEPISKAAEIYAYGKFSGAWLALR